MLQITFKIDSKEVTKEAVKSEEHISEIVAYIFIILRFLHTLLTSSVVQKSHNFKSRTTKNICEYTNSLSFIIKAIKIQSTDRVNTKPIDYLLMIKLTLSNI